MSGLPYELTLADLPVCAIPAGEFYVLFDVRGQERARFDTEEAAAKVVADINEQQLPELMQPDIHDTGVEPVQEKQVQHKEKKMPRGVPKKRRASKKRAVKKTVKKAAVVKKAPKKTMKKKKRKSRRNDY